MANKFPQMPEMFLGERMLTKVDSPLSESIFDVSDKLTFQKQMWQGFFQNDPTPKWIYHFESGEGVQLAVSYSKDKLISYQKGSAYDEKVDISIYYETEDVPDPVCFVKMTDELYTTFNTPDKGKEWKEVFLTTIIEKEGRRGVKIDKERLSKAIDITISSEERIGLLYQIAVLILQEAAELIRGFKISENHWNPDHPAYEPGADVKLLEFVTKNWDSFKENSDSFLEKVDSASKWCREHLGLLGKIAASILEPINKFCREIFNVLDSLVDGLKKAIHYIKLAYAYISGVINEIVEMIASIVDIVALLFALTNETERFIIKRTIGKLIKEYLNDPGKIVDQIKKGYRDFVSRYNQNKTEYEVAYNAGEDTVRLILFIESVVTIIKTIRNLPKKFESLRNYLDKLSKKPSVRKRIDNKILDAIWRARISHYKLGNKRLLELAGMRRRRAKNIAAMRVRVVFEDGTIDNLNFIANNSEKNYITNGIQLSPGKIEELKSMKPDFWDNNLNRVFDSEHKMLIMLDEYMATKNMSIAKMQIEIESIFKPCRKCQEQILLRQEMYKAEVKVFSPRTQNILGMWYDVPGTEALNKYLKRLK
ncbi:hypothetical protein [Terrimonas ferruginea]|uniref:hypothetical protein n=1 Tax=Terrimonas ferruginea TaxID=249 RepID=UPI000406358B|nr:hypothetical protein [Terrimonas ferruginea]